MCNLYALRKSAAEVAAHFGVDVPVLSNAGEEIYPGAPGMVIRDAEGQRVMQSMTWGFPRPMKSKKTGLPIKPIPVNNIADLDNFMWRGIAPRPGHRCLIPLTGFAEAEGEKGMMTRTWFSVKDQPIAAWAGLWRVSDEWGPVYSGLMTNCNEAIRPVHDRMPVLLHRDEYDQWLHGGLDDVIGFKERCFPDALIVMERTTEPWRKRQPDPVEAPPLL
ncbi:MAG: SOS response-associated peptidase family protein [Sphingomonas sp.]|jgi:putative SOS response-associated peptidase YedK|uniref:SOS response-associated peptidase n=1 Tax=Sphingomonas sp. TaxID=28214 RepID=UPI00356655AB